MKRLAKYEPFTFARSKERSSVYIHFRNLPNGLEHKLRISNHEERERYGYKWQLRLDGVPPRALQKYRRRYFSSIDDLVRHFEEHYTRVENLNKELLAWRPTEEDEDEQGRIDPCNLALVNGPETAS